MLLFRNGLLCNYRIHTNFLSFVPRRPERVENEGMLGPRVNVLITCKSSEVLFGHVLVLSATLLFMVTPGDPEVLLITTTTSRQSVLQRRLLHSSFLPLFPLLALLAEDACTIISRPTPSN